MPIIQKGKEMCEMKTKYSKEFKEDALMLATNEGVAAASEN